MRRSTRQRMQVNYAEDNAEINELPDIPTDEAAIEHDKVTMKATTLRNDADSFSQEKLSQDYILSGGGFCLEENEIQEEEQPLPATILRKHSFEQQNDGQSQWPLEDGNCSNFLVTGGGVCMDESDPGIAPKSNLEGDSSKGHEEACHESLQVLENLGRKQTFGDGAAQNLLSAMPSLKRKRKK